MFIKSIALGLGLVAGIAMAANAQTVQMGPATGGPGPSVASLPPSPAAEGPRTNSYTGIASATHQALTPSGAYPGPGLGSGTGHMPPRFEKPADWDQNVSLHPYTSSGMGPKPN